MQKVFLILGVCVLGVFICLQSVNEQAVVKDVVLENVEALANVENRLPMNCIGSGEVKCPDNGVMVAAVYIGYSLR